MWPKNNSVSATEPPNVRTAACKTAGTIGKNTVDHIDETALLSETISVDLDERIRKFQLDKF